MSKHIHFESNMSLSGANADTRVPVTPSQQKLVLAKLYAYVTGNSVSGSLPEAIDAKVKLAAKHIKKAGSKAVVITGIQDVSAQTVALELNSYLSSKAFNGYLCAKKFMNRRPDYASIADVYSLIYSVLIKLTVEALEG